MSFARSLSPLVDFVFPPRCPLCGEGIAAQAGLCVACWSELVIPGKPACKACARPFAGVMDAGSQCGACLAEPPSHDGIAAATIYNEPSRKLVLAFKHGGRIAMAPMMARLIAAQLDGVDAGWLIVPVPLHRWRLWQRGFNQAAVLAGELAKLTGAQLCVDALERRKATPMLGGLGARERDRMLAGAIAVRPDRSALLAGKNVLLVDDVLTSGATSNACIAALKRAGADRVVIGCFARVLDEAFDMA
ncbi:MAG: ComF family protein [Novosphingobium sp.]|nr:ComF family protein [Novosphingobium sp.]